jgi:hypothetical protein
MGRPADDEPDGKLTIFIRYLSDTSFVWHPGYSNPGRLVIHCAC